jgi:hypothetical protein
MASADHSVRCNDSRAEASGKAVEATSAVEQLENRAEDNGEPLQLAMSDVGHGHASMR